MTSDIHKHSCYRHHNQGRHETSIKTCKMNIGLVKKCGTTQSKSGITEAGGGFQITASFEV
uniref:Uncharacterized protein n=1 Tax=Macaca fascicularis TaxID=9541 RepID=Q9GMN4_MACFA|nr:hypothetical protein [Macaca fascicularis]